ncbi:MAG: PIN domain nuclease [Thermoprotei archaeon]|nr:MAG: PIN domain nuclease [Thermoprotei archaeon]RLF25583.1 MAG: PIN domain nuclease [Thermoprotei archaeon]
MIVIDASSLAKYIIKEKGWLDVERYLLEEEVHTLDLALKEVVNVIWKQAILLHNISLEEAEEKYIALMKLVEGEVIALDDEMKYLKEAFETALDMKITIYDALYVVKAKADRAQLLTSDKRQHEVAQKLGIKAILV